LSGASKTKEKKPACFYCGKGVHSPEHCYKKQLDEMSKQIAALKPGSSARAAAAHGFNPQGEEAGSASASLPHTALSTDEADDVWIADTGATAHMTPRRSVFATYRSFSTPVRLADGNIVMSAGVGSIVFMPRLGSVRGRPIEFQHVLHVPALRCNLISVLYLVRWKQWSVLAEGDTISFRHENTLWFTAHINERNSASLEGEMQIAPSSSMVVAPAAPSKQLAAAVTLPLDLELWHRRTMHHHLGGLKRAIRDKLITGVKITSLATPDPICEPRLAGKMHSDGFPSTGC